jgi:hypothetical protein
MFVLNSRSPYSFHSGLISSAIMNIFVWSSELREGGIVCSVRMISAFVSIFLLCSEGSVSEQRKPVKLRTFRPLRLGQLDLLAGSDGTRFRKCIVGC